jgi:hypothetical protein
MSEQPELSARSRLLHRAAAWAAAAAIVGAGACGGTIRSRVRPPSEPGRPYLQEYSRVDGIAVWIVDGTYVRENLDEEFTNFGQHYAFSFIPDDEFWLDRQNVPGEEGFFIDHLLVEHRLMAGGMDYDHALYKGDAAEKAEREKTALAREAEALHDAHEDATLAAKIHKEQLTDYSGEVSVWVVDGELIRDLCYIDFTEGGHDKVYKFIPPKEVWIDDDVSPAERPFILLHELHERHLMDLGWAYDKAHPDSSRIEFECRRHPERLAAALDREIALNRTAGR